MVDYTSPTQNEPTRAHVVIQSVDVVNMTAIATDINLNKSLQIYLNLTPGGQVITWPRQSEEWWVTTINGQWVLDYKGQYGNEGFQEEAVAGDVVLATNTGNVVIRGNNVRIANNSSSDIVGDVNKSIAANTAARNTALFGGPTRTAPFVCELKPPSDYAFTTDLFATTWSVVYDTDAMITIGSPSFITLPVAGRWRAHFHLACAVTGPGLVIARITQNAASPTSSFAVGSQTPWGTVANGGTTELSVDAFREEFCTAGTKLYWETFTNAGTGTVKNSLLGMPTFINVRYVGAV